MRVVVMETCFICFRSLSCVNGTSSSSNSGRTLEQAEAEAAVTVASSDNRGANKPPISLMDLRDALQVGLTVLWGCNFTNHWLQFPNVGFLCHFSRYETVFLVLLVKSLLLLLLPSNPPPSLLKIPVEVRWKKINKSTCIWILSRFL